LLPPNNTEAAIFTLLQLTGHTHPGLLASWNPWIFCIQNEAGIQMKSWQAKSCHDDDAPPDEVAPNEYACRAENRTAPRLNELLGTHPHSHPRCRLSSAKSALCLLLSAPWALL